jgi:NDP-sugar pyrophosphorylase family protein
MINKPTCLILCGGKGERLMPLTKYLQKCMLPVKGIPFIEYVIAQTKLFGLDDIVLCCGYKGDQIINTFGPKYKYSYSASFINTGARLKRALPTVESDNVIVFNGDSYCNISNDLFWSSYDQFMRSGANLAKLLVSKKNSLLASFIPNPIDDYYGAGIYFFKKSFLNEFDYSPDLSIEDDIIPNHNCEYLKLPEECFTIDIGTVENYKEVNDGNSRQGRVFFYANKEFIREKTTQYTRLPGGVPKNRIEQFLR